MLRAVDELGFVSSGGRTIDIQTDYELRWYIPSRQMVDSDVNPIDSRKRLCDLQTRENGVNKAIRGGDMLCLCHKDINLTRTSDEETPEDDGWFAASTIQAAGRRASRAVTGGFGLRS